MTLAALEAVLRKLGHEVTPGKAVEAASTAFASAVNTNESVKNQSYFVLSIRINMQMRSFLVIRSLDKW